MHIILPSGHLPNPDHRAEAEEGLALHSYSDSVTNLLCDLRLVITLM